MFNSPLSWYNKIADVVKISVLWYPLGAVQNNRILVWLNSDFSYIACYHIWNFGWNALSNDIIWDHFQNKLFKLNYLERRKKNKLWKPKWDAKWADCVHLENNICMINIKCPPKIYICDLFAQCKYKKLM